MDRRIFSLVAAFLFIYVAWPLCFPAAMGAVLAVLLHPLLEKLENIRISPRIGSGILTLGITLIVILPTALLVFLGAKAGVQQLQAIKNAPKGGGGTWLESLISAPHFEKILDFATRWLPIEKDQVVGALQDLATSIGIKIADLLGQLVTHLPAMAMGLVITVVSIYFCLVDGRKWVTFLRRHSLFTPEQTDELLSGLAQTCRSVILASIVSGLAQGGFFLVVCWLVRLPNAELAGFLVFVASFVPIIGSAPITFGFAIQQLIFGQTTQGIILLIAAASVAVIDNFVRPWFLKGQANLHPFLAFLGALGGLEVMGPLGVFLGPIIAALFVLSAQMVLNQDSRSNAA